MVNIGQTIMRRTQSTDIEKVRYRPSGQRHHVSRYAQSMGCSERTLTRTCSAAAGIGAKRFIALRLALDAKRILAQTEVPIVAIAERLGFDDATNFIKFFRGVESCTPGHFRRRMALDDQRARS
jgi:AraC-like DNA-binding protein